MDQKSDGEKNKRTKGLSHLMKYREYYKTDSHGKYKVMCDIKKTIK